MLLREDRTVARKKRDYNRWYGGTVSSEYWCRNSNSCHLSRLKAGTCTYADSTRGTGTRRTRTVVPGTTPSGIETCENAVYIF
jgi:hypothetical protein